MPISFPSVRIFPTVATPTLEVNCALALISYISDVPSDALKNLNPESIYSAPAH